MSNTANNVKVRETTCGEELMAIRDSLDILGGKWKLMILRYLSNRQGQDIHFKKMQREISGISAKMLSKELKDLERNLLITRSVQDQHLIMVYYAVTEYGMSVLPLTENLVEWGLYHRQKIKAEMK